MRVEARMRDARLEVPMKPQKQDHCVRVPLAEISAAEADARQTRIEAPQRQLTGLLERKRRAAHRVSRLPGTNERLRRDYSNAETAGDVRKCAPEPTRTAVPHIQDNPKRSVTTMSYSYATQTESNRQKAHDAQFDAPDTSSRVSSGDYSRARDAAETQPSLLTRPFTRSPSHETMTTTTKAPYQLHSTVRPAARSSRAARGMRLIR